MPLYCSTWRVYGSGLCLSIYSLHAENSTMKHYLLLDLKGYSLLRPVWLINRIYKEQCSTPSSWFQMPSPRPRTKYKKAKKVNGPFQLISESHYLFLLFFNQQNML